MQRAATQQSSELESVAALPGEPRNVSAAGVTRTEQRLTTLENDSPFDTSAGTRRRLVVVADNDRAARATLAAIRWFKTAAPRSSSRPVGDQRRAAVACNRCDAGSAARVSAGEGFLRSSRTAREPVPLAMGRRIRLPMFCCRFEAETCSPAAARLPVHSRRRWRVDRRSAPCRPSSDRRAKQMARRSWSTF